jgi:hypothetical protein
MRMRENAIFRLADEVTATEYLIGWHSDADYASFCDTSVPR